MHCYYDITPGNAIADQPNRKTGRYLTTDTIADFRRRNRRHTDKGLSKASAFCRATICGTVALFYHRNRTAMRLHEPRRHDTRIRDTIRQATQQLQTMKIDESWRGVGVECKSDGLMF